jgi:predicted NBD/HSP70 family sugar kinase
VVLGGGISEVMDLFQHTMLETIGQQAFPPVFRNTRIVRAALGNGAGVRGAAALAVQQIV